MVAATIGEFCAGGIIPLPFLPEKVQNIIGLLPFAATQSTPFLIFGGSLSMTESLQALGIQLFWAVTLVFAGKIWMCSALKRVVLQGG